MIIGSIKMEEINIDERAENQLINDYNNEFKVT